LYIYASRVSDNFFEAPLWYGLRFAGGATNPHQIALFLSVITFINLRSMVRTRGAIRRLWYMALAAVSIFMGSQTQVSTWVVAVVISAFYFVVVLISLSFSRASTRVVVATGTVILVLGGILLQFEHVASVVQDFIASDENGQGRFDIWSTTLDAFALSPVFGLGPGTHGMGGTIELHNTYLEVLVATGIVGFAAFAAYSVYAVRTMFRRDPTLPMLILPLFVYGMGGFAARRLVYWTILVLALAIATCREDNMSAAPLSRSRRFPRSTRREQSRDVRLVGR
jgi:O-antigen ligase